MIRLGYGMKWLLWWTQLKCVCGWFITLGACPFVIYLEGDLYMVLQGWGFEDPIEYDL